MKQLYKKGLRKCWVCKEIKKIDEFSTDKKSSGGKTYNCKKCHNKRLIKYRIYMFSLAKKYKLEHNIT